MPSIVESLYQIHLTEAKVDRYLPMISVYKKYSEFFPEAYDKLEDDVRNIVDMFKRDDRIVLLMRYRIIDFVLSKVLFSQSVSDKDILKKLAAPFRKYIRYIEKVDPDISIHALKHSAENHIVALYDLWPHYVGLGYQSILDYNWDGKALHEVMNDLHDMENDFQAAADSVIDTAGDDSAQKVISYPDGSAWFDLKKPYCEVEGKAMGHCGNRGNPEPSHTILSFRTPIDSEGNSVSDPKSQYWKPHLTFVLDTVSGKFTEMKGRKNGKPSKKYHRVIVDLLRMDFVKGIIGGGYKPENNFSLFDLSAGLLDSMLREKPELVGAYDAMIHPEKAKDYPIMLEKLVGVIGSDFYVPYDGDILAGKSDSMIGFFQKIGFKSEFEILANHLDGGNINQKQVIGDPDYYTHALYSGLKKAFDTNPALLDKLLLIGKRDVKIDPENLSLFKEFYLQALAFNRNDAVINDGIKKVFSDFLMDIYVDFIKNRINGIMANKVKISSITADGRMIAGPFYGYVIPLKDIQPHNLSALISKNIFIEPMVNVGDMAEQHLDELATGLNDYILSVGSTNEAIKLRGLGNSDGPHKFMDALAKYTTPNPMDDQEVIYGHVTMNVYPMGDHIHLSNIMTYGDKGAGHGSDALSLLTELADHFDVEIKGIAKTYSTNKDHLPFDKLVEWYRQHDFKIGSGDSTTGVNIKYIPK